MFAPPMVPTVYPTSRLRLAAGAGVLFALATAPLSIGSASLQDVRPDQIFRTRRGDVVKVTGVVTENSLETVRVDRGDDEPDDYDSDEVVRIVWGQVPPSYQDGQTYLSRGDHENAVARFRIAATDASAREVVKADARLHATEALIAWGGSDANRYGEAVSEVERFLTDHPSNRGVPRAQALKGRAQWLSGNAVGAAATFKALYEQGASDPPAPGYDRVLCLEAGLSAAQAFLAAKAGDAAEELFNALEGAFREVAQATEDDPDRLKRLIAGQGEASVGEGWVALANGDADKAVRFFERNMNRSELGAAGRFSAMLGLAEAHLAAGELRKAQLGFARASALDFTSRDRTARAMVGLADCTLQLGDADAKVTARALLESATSQYSNTPAAARAAVLLKAL